MDYPQYIFNYEKYIRDIVWKFLIIAVINPTVGMNFRIIDNIISYWLILHYYSVASDSN